MNTSRKGKIARLPKSVRDTLNERLADGETGKDLVDWLNGLPEVQAAVAKEFGGRPIREQNLSKWRAGGFEDWLRQQEARDWARTVSEQAAELAGEMGAGSLADHLALMAVVSLGKCLRKPTELGEPSAEQIKEVLAVCQELSKLRRGDHEVEWLRLEREVMEIRRLGSKESLQKQFMEWARLPENQERVHGPRLSRKETEQRIRQIFGLEPLPEEPEEPGDGAGPDGEARAAYGDPDRPKSRMRKLCDNSSWHELPPDPDGGYPRLAESTPPP